MDRTPFLDRKDVALYTVEETDLERLRDIVNHRDVWTWISVCTPQNLQDEEQFLEQLTADDDQITLLVYSKDEEKHVGTIEFRLADGPEQVAELGIMLDADHHSQGIGTAALELMLDYGFSTMNLHRIWTRADAENKKSCGLMEKVGFTHEGTMRDHRFARGDHQDVEIYGLLRDEWTG